MDVACGNFANHFGAPGPIRQVRERLRGFLT